MKRHLQCAEQHWFPSNITKYCACHEICKFKISAETPWIASANRKTIRRHSDDKIVISHPPPRRPSSPHLGDAFCMEKYNISRSGYLSKLHQVLRLLRRVTLQLHQILRLPRNMHPTLLNASILYSSILYASLLHTSIFYASILYASILHASILYASILWASILSWHLFSLGIYSLLASILSRHLFSLGIHSLLASILSGHLFSLGIYSLLASLLSWHLFSLGIYSLLASILSRHLFSLGIYSLSASILSWHLFPLGIYSLLASIPSGHLFSLGIYCLLALPLIILYYILYHIIFYHILIYFVVLSDVNHWFGSLFGQNRTVHNWSQMYSITSRHCVMPSLHPETTESRRSMTSMKLSRVKNNTCKEISLQKSGRLRLCNSENASFYPKLSLPSRTSYLTLLFFL